MSTTTNKQVPAHRRSTTSGYARGEETRLKIIQAAVELFGANGYERTSTREIAARAGVNAPALQYYFDGKEGLYLACANYMAERGRSQLLPVMAEIRQCLAAKPGVDELIDCVCAIFERAADFIMMASELETWARFIVWEDLDSAAVPASARAVIENGIRREINTLLCELVGRITGRHPQDADTRIRVLTLGGQVSVFHTTHGQAIAEIGWSDVDDKKLEILKAIIRDQTAAALRAAARKN